MNAMGKMMGMARASAKRNDVTECLMSCDIALREGRGNRRRREHLGRTAEKGNMYVCVVLCTRKGGLGEQVEIGYGGDVDERGRCTKWDWIHMFVERARATEVRGRVWSPGFLSDLSFWRNL